MSLVIRTLTYGTLLVALVLDTATEAGSRGVQSEHPTRSDLASGIYTICPTDTVLRPGRRITLIHGLVNATRDTTIYTCYSIEGSAWPAATSLGDLNPLPPGHSEQFPIVLEAPDSAVAGINWITWRASCFTRLGCTYAITVPELVGGRSVRVAADRVSLSWAVADSSADTAVVFRAGPDRTWRRLGEVFAAVGDTLRYQDLDVVPGARYSYRLGFPVEARQIFRGEVDVSVPAIPLELLLLTRAGANPASGPVQLSVTLGDSAPAELELFDVRGRRLDRRRLTDGSGRYELSLGRALAPGMYFVRLVQGRRRQSLPVSRVQ